MIYSWIQETYKYYTTGYSNCCILSNESILNADEEKLNLYLHRSIMFSLNVFVLTKPAKQGNTRICILLKQNKMSVFSAGDPAQCSLIIKVDGTVREARWVCEEAYKYSGGIYGLEGHIILVRTWNLFFVSPELPVGPGLHVPDNLLLVPPLSHPQPVPHLQTLAE